MSDPVDLSETIIPKSDQLNADDLIAGPMTVTITDVRKGNAQQPIVIHLQETPGRPWKPSKGQRRVLVKAWGKNGSEYVGKRATLYREPSVKYAGQDVGGIRVSHLSHIDEPMKFALTVSQSKRETVTIEPLGDAPAPAKRTDAETLDDEIGKAVAGFNQTHGVTLDRLVHKLGKARTRWGTDELEQLRTIWRDLHNGATTVDAAFPNGDTE